MFDLFTGLTSIKDACKFAFQKVKFEIDEVGGAHFNSADDNFLSLVVR